MAEGENKKVVEMSIWFVILLIVVILSAAFIISKNNQVKQLQTTIVEHEKTIARLNKDRELHVESISELVNQVQDGNITNRDLVEKLNGLLGSGEVAEIPEVETSGEELPVVSGEVAK